MEERSSRELPRLGAAGVDAVRLRRGHELIDDTLKEDWIARHLKLSRVLARVGMRSAE